MNKKARESSARPFGHDYFQPIEGESLRVATGVQAGNLIKTHVTLGPKGNIVD